MSDSDVENPFARPSDSVIEKELRRQTGLLRDVPDTSVNTIRVATEIALKLERGFFRNNFTWKSKSKDVINDQIEKDNDAPSSTEDLPPVKTQPTQRAAKHAPTDDDEEPPRKKSRKSKEPSRSESELSNVESISSIEEKPNRSKKAARNRLPSRAAVKKAPIQLPKSSESEDSEEEPKRAKQIQGKRAKPNNVVSDDSVAEEQDEQEDESNTRQGTDASESEMSVLIDEDPGPKSRRGRPKGSSSAASSKPKPKTQKKKTATATTSKSKESDLPPDEAEIKRLQSWLVKCGIRKIWGRELKPYETNKEKIRHLKKMLDDVGMTGRFSLEKANQIKEARELAADIEAVKEGNERWGMGEGSEEESKDDKPKGRLVKGRKTYDFLSSDAEETD